MLAWFGNQIGTLMILEIVIVTLPVTVETELPGSCGGEANNVVILWLVIEIGNDHNVIRRSALVPTVEGNDLTFIVQVIDLGELPAETAREAVVIESQPDEVARYSRTMP